MPRSVYLPLRQKSNSPRAHAGHGSGSGRRTTPTTRSPAAKPLPSGASRTRPSDSWPRISRSEPGGAQPYSPSMISRSVPQTPSAMPSTSRSPGPGSGSGMSTTAAEPACSGITVSARMRRTYPHGTSIALPSRRMGSTEFHRVRNPPGDRARAAGRRDRRSTPRSSSSLDHRERGAARAVRARDRRHRARDARSPRVVAFAIGHRQPVLERPGEHRPDDLPDRSSTAWSPLLAVIAARAREHATDPRAPQRGAGPRPRRHAGAARRHPRLARRGGDRARRARPDRLRQRRPPPTCSAARASRRCWPPSPASWRSNFTITHEDGVAGRARRPPRAAA